jgi:chitodextrinase
LSSDNKEASGGNVVEFSRTSNKAAYREEVKREAKARSIQKRFSAARKASTSKSKAAERLKKVFKKPSKPPTNRR